MSQWKLHREGHWNGALAGSVVFKELFAKGVIWQEHSPGGREEHTGVGELVGVKWVRYGGVALPTLAVEPFHAATPTPTPTLP